MAQIFWKINAQSAGNFDNVLSCEIHLAHSTLKLRVKYSLDNGGISVLFFHGTVSGTSSLSPPSKDDYFFAKLFARRCGQASAKQVNSKDLVTKRGCDVG